jgi:serine/threonine-protein kinase
VDDAARQTVEVARALERRGQIDAAVQAFLRVGEVDEAARALLAVRRSGDAARVLMQSLGVPVAKLATVDAARKKVALKAAVCFGQAGETQSAVDIYVALGETLRAVELLQKAGDLVAAAKLQATVGRAPTQEAAAGSLASAQRLETAGKHEAAMEAYLQLKQYGPAARMAHTIGKKTEAAKLFNEAGMPFEAAICFHEVGDAANCLASLIRVSRDDPRYRKAAAQAVKIASTAGQLDFHLEHFLSKFVSSGPQDEREVEAYYLLSKLYQQNHFPDNAKDALVKLLAVSPRYRDAPQRLVALEKETQNSSAAYEKILEEEMAFRSTDSRGGARGATLGDLPLAPLPDLPDLPPMFAATAGTVAAPARPVASARATAVGVGPGQAAPQAPAPSPAPASPAAPAGAAGGMAAGMTIASRYRLEQKVGQGGMAAVFKATDLELSEVIALKVFTQVVADEQMLARFKQELSLSRQLNHPNIVRLYDIGTHEGLKFLTMELLTGSDLRGLMTTTPMSFVRGLDYMLQACAGLQATHDRGVVHRDIKPDNFFVTTDGVLKLMDFGIAKRQSAQGLTQVGMMAGTPQYMSPEQVSNFGNVTSSTDLYALGVMAYELFTATLPFDHEEVMPILMMQVTQPPPPPSTRNFEIPDDLEAVILKLLEKEPVKRFQSCTELAKALLAIRRRLVSEGQS